MPNNAPLKSFVFLSGTGCLLPALIIFNLLFGWTFLKPLHWLTVEAILILLFVIKGLLFTRRVISASSRRRDGAIDVEAEVIEDKRRKKAFTLLELIIVIIIIGILATVGLTQYGRVVERGRTPEAKAILGALRKAELSYYLEKGAYTTSFTDLGISAPTACTSTHYFYYYAILGSGDDRVGACRCTSGGKNPDYSIGYYLRLFIDGRYDAQLPSGTVDMTYW